jgi:A/G-specific adenine glycosylase
MSRARATESDAETDVADAGAASGIAAPLLGWFDRHRRDLPWRRSASPYRTLVSEFMLQQTGVATVAPYFDRFTARFPTLPALAAAAEEEVTALWSGLGYYARARNLRRAAIAVMERHGGQLPADEETLRALPGVGAYTAAAVAAIAFDRRAFALDGNGVRVLARLYAVRDAVNLPATRARLQGLGQALVPARRAGDFNQAVMELGALICAPKVPRCAQCPVRSSCAAAAAGVAEALPVKHPRAARRSIRIACALVMRAGQVLLVRRQAGELLAGTWALPSAVVDAGAEPHAVARAAAARHGIITGRPSFRGQIRHVFTHRDLTAEVFVVPERRSSSRRRSTTTSSTSTSSSSAAPLATARAGEPERRWASPQGLARLGISSFTRKTLAAGLDGDKQDKPENRP